MPRTRASFTASFPCRVRAAELCRASCMLVATGATCDSNARAQRIGCGLLFLHLGMIPLRQGVGQHSRAAGIVCACRELAMLRLLSHAAGMLILCVAAW